jgi:hypothetical protein
MICFNILIASDDSIFWDIYIAIIYGILYLEFVAYPIVFTGIRGWSAGISGLAFTGMAVGCFTIIGSEPLIRRMINAHKKDPETGKVPPEAYVHSGVCFLVTILQAIRRFAADFKNLRSMVSIICIAAALAPIGELWFAVCFRSCSLFRSSDPAWATRRVSKANGLSRRS